MGKLSVIAIENKSSKAWASKSQWDALYSDCGEFALWDRNPYANNGSGKSMGSSGSKGGDKTPKRVFDSTLMTDATKLANRLQYELLPMGHQWADLEPGPFIREDMRSQAKSDLHVLQEILFMVISLSNFDMAIAEWLLELVVYGTACMLILPGDPDDEPVSFRCVSQSHVAFTEGANGKIDFISRKHKMRLSAIKGTWPDASNLPKDDPDGGDPELDLIDVCYHDRENKVWHYEVLIVGGVKGSGGKTSSEKIKIVSRQYPFSLWVIARWSKAADEERGRSLVMAALPDARVLSAMKNFVLRQAALQVGGVFLARNDGVLNAKTVKVFPGSVIPVRSTGGGNLNASLVPLQVGGNVQFSDMVMTDLINNIHRIMLNDGIPAINDGVRSATEFVERLRELQQSLGAPFSRVLKEGIVPMLETTIGLLGIVGLVPIQAGTKIKLNGGEVKVKFQSPLVQGQSIREVEAADQAMTLTAKHGGPEAVGVSFKVEDFGAWVGEKLGVVPNIIRSKEDRSKLQQQAAQVVSAQMGVNGQGGGVMPSGGNQPSDALPVAA